MEEIQYILLKYIDDDNDKSYDFQNIIDLFNDQGIYNNHYELKLIFNLILGISNHHHRSSHFFDKIAKIMLLFKDEMKNLFSNSEIFDIYKSNKRILLFLIEEKIIEITKSIGYFFANNEYKNGHYQEYFSSEINPLFQKDSIENFEEKRKVGENERYICELIRNDSIDEFIIQVNKTNLLLTQIIETSIFETSLFLIKNKPTLIEYAAFYGSIQIFKYLLMNQIDLTESLWLYAIHGNNAEIINILEDHHVQPNSIEECLKQAIKCYHNEISNYIIDNIIQNENKSSLIVQKQSLKSYNFSLIQSQIVNESVFYDLCKYDYYPFVKILLETTSININAICPRSIINQLF